MERKIKFAPGEYYHIFSRGVEKRKIFMNLKDFQRFMVLLYILNHTSQFHIGNFLKGEKERKTLHDIFACDRKKTLVSILAYALMPNHFHFVVYEKKEGGISKFMGKLLTAYSMYFNTKYERSGPLFVRPFRSVHIDNDPQFMHIFSYVHLNPLDVIEPNWKKNGISDHRKAKQFLQNYTYSSYKDVLGIQRVESKILDIKNLPDFLQKTLISIKEYEKRYRGYISSNLYQGESLV